MIKEKWAELIEYNVLERSLEHNRLATELYQAEFEKEMISTAKKVVEFKVAAEANVVSILYKTPDKLFDTNLTLDEFTENTWKVFFQIAHDIILVECT